MPKKLSEKETHKITYSKGGSYTVKQGAIGKADVVNIIRALWKDGYTHIEIKTIQP